MSERVTPELAPQRNQTQEALCSGCWSPVRVQFRAASPGELNVGALHLTFEAPCPYCGRPNEFSRQVSALYPPQMSEAQRLLTIVHHRMNWLGCELQARVRRGHRQLTRLVVRLHESARVVGLLNREKRP